MKISQAKIKKYSIYALYIVDFIYVIFIRRLPFTYLLLSYLIISAILCIAFHSAILAIIGNYNYATGKIDTALKFLRLAIKRNTKSPSAYLNYAIYLVRSFQGEEALKYLEKALSLEPKVLTEKNITLTMGSCYWALGDIDKALEILEGMRKKYEYVNSNVLTTLSYMYFLKGDLETARELTEKAIEDNANNGSAWDNMGQIHYKTGDMDAAKTAFNKAVEIKKDLPDSYYYLGLISEKEGDTEQAIKFLTMAKDCSITALNTITREQVEEMLKNIDKTGKEE